MITDNLGFGCVDRLRRTLVRRRKADHKRYGRERVAEIGPVDACTKNAGSGRLCRGGDWPNGETRFPSVHGDALGDQTLCRVCRIVGQGRKA